MIIKSNTSIAFPTVFWSNNLVLIAYRTISFFYKHTISMMHTLINCIFFIVCWFWWLLLFNINLLLNRWFCGWYFIIIWFCTTLWKHLRSSNLLSWTLCKWWHFWWNSWFFRCLGCIWNFMVWKILFIYWSLTLHFIFIIFLFIFWFIFNYVIF
jgi:hypothetical protein